MNNHNNNKNPITINTILHEVDEDLKCLTPKIMKIAGIRLLIWNQKKPDKLGSIFWEASLQLEASFLLGVPIDGLI